MGSRYKNILQPIGLHGLPYGWPAKAGGVPAPPVPVNWFVDYLTDPNGTTWPAHSPNIDFNVDGNPWVQRGPAPVGSTDIQANLGRQLDAGDGQGRWIDVDLPSITGDLYAEVFHLLNSINPGWMGIQIRGTVAQPGSRWIAWHQASSNLAWLNSPGGSQSTGFVAGVSDVIQLILTANGASVTCVYNNLTTGVFASQTRVAAENLTEVQHGAWQRTVFGAGTQDFYEDILFVELSEAPTETNLSRFTGANGTIISGGPYTPDVGGLWGGIRGNTLQWVISGNKASYTLSTADPGSLIICESNISDLELTATVTLGDADNDVWFRTNGAGEGVLVRIGVGSNTLSIQTYDGASYASLASVGQTYNAGDIVVLKIHALADAIKIKDIRRNLELTATSSFNETGATGVGFGERNSGGNMLIDDFRVTDAWPV